MTGCGRRRKCLVFVAGGMFVPRPKRAFLRRIFGSRLALTANCTFSPICHPRFNRGIFLACSAAKKHWHADIRVPVLCRPSGQTAATLPQTVPPLSAVHRKAVSPRKHSRFPQNPDMFLPPYRFSGQHSKKNLKKAGKSGILSVEVFVRKGMEYE